MNLPRNIALAVALSSLMSLGACAGLLHSQEPAYAEAKRAFEAAENDPDIRAHAPVPLANAGESLRRARMSFDESSLRHFSYMALKQVQIARVLAEAREHEEQFLALIERGGIETAALRLPPVSSQDWAALEIPLLPPVDRPAAGSVSRALGEPANAAPDAAAVAPAPEPAIEIRRLAPPVERRLFGIAPGLRPSLLLTGFAPDAAGISPEDAETLRLLADFLTAHPGRRLTIAGYAGGDGPISKIVALSEARARAVKDFLVARGVEAARIWAIGLGVPAGDDGAEPDRVRVTLRPAPSSGGEGTSAARGARAPEAGPGR